MALASLRYQRNAQGYEESRQGMVFQRSPFRHHELIVTAVDAPGIRGALQVLGTQSLTMTWPRSAFKGSVRCVRDQVHDLKGHLSEIHTKIRQRVWEVGSATEFHNAMLVR